MYKLTFMFRVYNSGGTGLRSWVQCVVVVLVGAVVVVVVGVGVAAVVAVVAADLYWKKW